MPGSYRPDRCPGYCSVVPDCSSSLFFPAEQTWVWTGSDPRQENTESGRCSCWRWPAAWWSCKWSWRCWGTHSWDLTRGRCSRGSVWCGRGQSSQRTPPTPRWWAWWTSDVWRRPAGLKIILYWAGTGPAPSGSNTPQWQGKGCQTGAPWQQSCSPRNFQRTPGWLCHDTVCRCPSWRWWRRGG